MYNEALIKDFLIAGSGLCNIRKKGENFFEEDF